jgi:hypothetical protein
MPERPLAAIMLISALIRRQIDPAAGRITRHCARCPFAAVFVTLRMEDEYVLAGNNKGVLYADCRLPPGAVFRLLFSFAFAPGSTCPARPASGPPVHALQRRWKCSANVEPWCSDVASRGHRRDTGGGGRGEQS